MKNIIKLISKYFPDNVSIIYKLIKEEFIKKKFGFSASAGLITIGFDLSELFKGVIIFCFFASLVVAYLFLWRIYHDIRPTASLPASPAKDTIKSQAESISDMNINVFLISLGSLIASTVLLLIGAFTQAPDNQSILLSMFQSTQRIETGVDDIHGKLEAGMLSSTIQFDIENTSNSSENLIVANLIWPDESTVTPKKCTITKKSRETRYYSAKMPNCDKIVVTIKDLPETKNPAELAQIMGGITSQFPVIEVTTKRNKRLQINAHMLGATITTSIFNHIKATKESGGTSIFGFDPEEMQQEQRKRMNEQQLKQLKSLIICSPRGCLIERGGQRALCENKAQSISFGRGNKKNEYTIDLTDACIFNGSKFKGLQKDKTCVSAPENIPALYPNQKVNVEVKFEERKNLSFATYTTDNLSSNMYGNSSTSDKAVVLKPSPEQNAIDVPYAIVSLNSERFGVKLPFEIQFAIGSCQSDHGVKYTGVLADHDGLGLAQVSTNINKFSIPQPVGDTIALAVDTIDGKRFGPYKYKFDLNEVIEKSSSSSKIPNIECRAWRDPKTNKQRPLCRAPINKTQIIEWYKVKTVTIGQTPDTLDTEITVELNPDDLIAALQNTNMFEQNSSDTVHFIPPQEWKNVFYQLTLKNGTTLPVQRLVL